ncbi:hypothetical protein Sango_0667800 [Sesamum angolense]|uniref:SWIM-type domain-containing protein n=1 Tax=Sesamum angolense TaxID=2727404 RepID=A0AAE1X7A2_9LAMI|nr:hypothetical protein Sango_0667800 [Sesamum angolense]
MLLATPGLPSCSNTDYLVGTSNPDFGAGTSNPDFSAGIYNFEPEYYTPNIVTVTQGLDNIDIHYTEPTQSHTPLLENFIPHENNAEDPIGDSFANESDDTSELDEAEYPIPPEDGPNDVDINIMVETFAQGMAETSSEPAMPNRTTQPTFYRFILFFEQIFPEIRADFVDVPNLSNFKNMVLKDLCWQAGSEYPLRKFNRIMEEIKKQHVGAFAYLDQINKEKWTTYHDGGWRCSILTINMSECINGVLKGVCRLSVSALVEITLERTVHYFRVRAIKGHKMLQNNQLWTDFACKMFISWQQKAVEHTVTKYSHSQQSASVVTRRLNGHGINTHVVKIANRECSCGKWNQFGIPCSHAQKVCGAYNISVASMVNDYYDLMAYNNIYSKHFEPVQSEDYWDDPNFQLVHDPTIRISTRPGRNQIIHIHNEMDWRQTRARQEAQQQRDSSILENMSEEDC